MKRFIGLACVVLWVAAARSADVDVLVQQLKTGDADQRRGAAKSLYELGPEAKDAVPDLAQALKDKDLFVRRFAAQALGEVGPDAAKQAVPALKAVLSDSKKEVVEAAATALGKMGTEGITTLTDLIKDKKQDVNVKKLAVQGLGKAGPGAKEAVPALIDVVKDSGAPEKGKKDMAGADLRVEAADALGDIGKDAADAVPALQELAQAKGKSALKSAAQNALAKITGQSVKKKKNAN
jgi:HEAT repeat protein